MGCDGGTIPRRDELVRTKKKPEQKDKVSELSFKWKHCALSQEKLIRPIVACELGRLYNKEAILKVLIDKAEFPTLFQHLRGLRDVKELNLTDNPAKQNAGADKGDGYVDSNVSDYICPVVGLEMSGKYKFCLLWSCGCVLSERALKEVKSKVCHKCGKDYTENDVIILNGTEEEVATMQISMVNRRALAKAAKKTKKGEKKVEVSDPCASTSQTTRPQQDKATDSNPKTEQKLTNGKLSAPGKLVRPPCNGKAGEKLGIKRKGDSIQNDPTASKTFKSLFTSSEAAKRQEQPHWVTYNPLYF